MRATGTKAGILALFVCGSWQDMSFAQEADPVEEAEDSAVDFTYSAKDLSLLDLLSMQVVSASASTESVARAPAVIEVVTAEEIRRYGYRSVAEALQMIAGLDLTFDHFQYSLGVRGITSGQRGWSRSVKVMIDGQPIAFRSSGENFLGVEAIPIAVVERIEVIRGPGSVLYGANAFLGVVNIITKDGYQFDGGVAQAGLEGGTNEENPWGTVAVGGDWDEFSFVASAVGESERLFGYPLVALPGRDVRVEGTSEAEHHFSGSMFGKMSFRPDESSELTLDGHYQSLTRDADFMDWGPLSHDNHLQLRNGFMRLAYDGRFEEKLFWRLAGALAYGSAGNDDHLNTAEGLSTYVDREVGYRGRDMEVSVRYQFPGSSQVSIGMDSSIDTQMLLNHYVVTPEGDRTLNPPGNTQTGQREFLAIGVYGNTTIYPFELAKISGLSALGLTGGARLDSQNLYGENFNSRAGIVYDLNKRHYVKLLYGSSYRAPTSTQLFANYIEPGGIIGNPNLKSERARTFEAAVGLTPFTGMTVRLDAFYTRVLDRVEIRQPAPSASVSNRRPVNSSPIDSFGGEVTLDYRIKNYAVFANYSGQSSSYQKTDFLSIDEERVDVHTPSYPAHMVKWGGSVDVPQYFLRMALNGRWVGARLGTLENNSLVNGRDYLTDRYALDPYVLVDVAVSSLGLRWWGYRETQLSGKIRNLFNTNYTFPSYGRFDIPGLARTFEISLRQEF